MSRVNESLEAWRQAVHELERASNPDDVERLEELVAALRAKYQETVDEVLHPMVEEEREPSSGVL